MISSSSTCGTGAPQKCVSAFAKNSSGLALFLCLQPIHILTLGFLLHSAVRPEMLFLSGAVSLLVYSYLIYEEYRRERFAVSPFLLYLFAACIRIGVVPIYLAFVLALGHKHSLLFAGWDVIAYSVPGLFIEVCGDWFLVAGYLFLSSRSAPTGSLRFRDPSLSYRVMLKAAVFLLSVTYALRAAMLLGLPLQSLGKPVAIFLDCGHAAALMTLFFAISKTSASKKRKRLIVIASVLFVAELAMSLSSYMKQDSIIVALPLFIFLASRMRTDSGHFRIRISFKRGIVLGLAIVLAVAVLFNYSNIRRKDFDLSGNLNTQRVPVTPYLRQAVMSLLPGTKEFSEAAAFPEGSLWSFFSRNNLILADAWCYSYVQREGTNNAKYLREVPMNLIPRVLWPEKPLVAYGRDIAVLLGQASSWESATTSTGFSMAGSLYFSYGYPLVVLGMFLNGMLLFLAWKVFSPSINVNPIATLVCITLFVAAIRWMEAGFDANTVRYVIVFGVYLPLSRVFVR